MSSTNPVLVPVATTPVVTESAAAPASGGMWNEISNCGANVLDLACRVIGIVMVALQKVCEWVLSLASSSFDKVHTWITGIPSTVSEAEERAALEEAIRAANIDEEILGSAPPTRVTSEPISTPTATRVQRLPAVQQLSELASASAGLSEEEQFALMQLQQRSGTTRTTRTAINHLTGGLSEADQLAALQQQTDEEPYVRPPMQFGGPECLLPMDELPVEDQFDMLQMQQVNEQEAREAERRILAEELARNLATVVIPGSTQQTERHEAPVISAAPRRQIPDELIELVREHQDGVAFLKQLCPNLLNDSVVDVDALLQPTAEAVAKFYLDPTREFPVVLPLFLTLPSTSLTSALTFTEALQQLRKAWIAEITGVNSNSAPATLAPNVVRAMSAPLKGRVTQLLVKLMLKPAFQACVYGACEG